MSEFKVGDKVRVKYTGECFSHYSDFFRENNLTQFASRFHEDVSISVGDYKVVGKGKHYTSCYGIVYVLEGTAGNIYLIGNDRGDSIELIKEEPQVIKACELMVEAHKNYAKYEGKKYKGFPIRHGAGKDYSELYVHNGRLFVGDGLWAYVHSDTELEEIKPEPKPVTFMEAMNSKRQIRPKGREEYRDLSRWVCEFPGMSEKNYLDIINGDWYIEE